MPLKLKTVVLVKVDIYANVITNTKNGPNFNAWYILNITDYDCAQNVVIERVCLSMSQGF